MSSIFIIDDDKALCRSLEIQLEKEGHEVKCENRGDVGLKTLKGLAPDLIILDLGLPDQHGIEVLKKIQEQHPGLFVVIITGQQDMKAAIQAMRMGAFDYIRKPFDIDDVLLALEKIERFKGIQKRKSSRIEVESPSQIGGPSVAFEGRGAVTGKQQDKSYEIIGSDKKILEVIKQIGLLSRDQVTVLIEGESGTGKELVARALHEASMSGEPFIAINCSAVVPTLPESELFGYEKGAFTGADSRKIGKLEHGGEGTVFFDEIGDMPLELQAKVLRVLQERIFERVGGLKSIPFRARIVAAPNRDLDDMVKQDKFRKDLYYRLAVAKIKLPPLRERRSDITALVHHFIHKIGSMTNREIKTVEDRAMRRLVSYDWPGNVRELENVLMRAIALTRTPELLSSEEVEHSLGKTDSPAADTSEIVPLQKVEMEYIKKALAAYNWNITQTAKALHISPTTLRKKISDYDLKA